MKNFLLILLTLVTLTATSQDTTFAALAAIRLLATKGNVATEKSVLAMAA